MANRRMINKSISISEQVNSMSEFAQLLFTWMIPHTDDWGIIPGSPKVLKALIIPMSKRSEEEVAEAVKEMANQKLVWNYLVDDKEYIQFCKFEQHQEGLHKRTRPKFPTYEQYIKSKELPGTSGNFTPNLTEQNLTEENLNSSSSKPDPFKHYENNIAPLVKTSRETIIAWIDMDNMQPELICRAIDIAVRKNKRDLAYIDGIIRKWIESNVFTVEQADAMQLEWDRKKNTNITPFKKTGTNPDEWK